MRILLFFFLLTMSVTSKEFLDAYNETVSKIMKNVNDLKKFCAYRHLDFCSKEQLEISNQILDEKLKKVKLQYESEQKKLEQEEKLRQYNRK
jgi:cell shape-determining protein MreC